MNLGEALNRRDNALNFIRLVLATSVIVGHCYLLTDTAPPTAWLHPRLAEWAVNAFFAISGYLIVGSRVRLPLATYVARRARRLLPGLWTVLIVVAFVISPVVAALAGEQWSARSAATYVVRNFAIYVGQTGIEDTLNDTPSGFFIWNGPLWTLLYEAGCYLGFGLVLTLGFARRHGALVCGLTVVVLMALHPFVIDTYGTGSVAHNTVRLTSFFAAGSLCWFLRDQIPARWWVFAACVAVVGVLSLVSDGQWYGQVPAAIALLVAGGLLPVRLGATNDISYGVYIYGWPMQQTLVALGATSLGVYAFLGLSLLLVFPCAWASWMFVERRWLPRRRDQGGADARIAASVERV